MKVDCDWNGKQNFIASINGIRVHMDATKPFGDGSTKQLVLAALCGCTGMDVIGLLKKNKQNPEKFRIEAEAEVSIDPPHEFEGIRLKYAVDGLCNPREVADAIHLSQTKYCAVSAVISRGAKIAFDVSVNGKKVGSGKANFQNSKPQANFQKVQL